MLVVCNNYNNKLLTRNNYLRKLSTLSMTLPYNVLFSMRIRRESTRCSEGSIVRRFDSPKIYQKMLGALCIGACCAPGDGCASTQIVHPPIVSPIYIGLGMSEVSIFRIQTKNSDYRTFGTQNLRTIDMPPKIQGSIHVLIVKSCKSARIFRLF